MTTQQAAWQHSEMEQIEFQKAYPLSTVILKPAAIRITGFTVFAAVTFITAVAICLYEAL